MPDFTSLLSQHHRTFASLSVAAASTADMTSNNSVPSSNLLAVLPRS